MPNPLIAVAVGEPGRVFVDTAVLCASGGRQPVHQLVRAREATRDVRAGMPAVTQA